MKEVEEIRKKILLTFRHLNFLKDNHTYDINGKNLKCVSNCLDNYKTSFDSNKISEAYAKKNKLKQEDVLKQWEDKKNASCDLGTRVHDFAERRFYSKEITPTIGLEEAVMNYWDSIDKDKNLIPVLCETRICSELLAYAGTFDLLLYDVKRKGLLVCDYKTNGDLYKNFRNQKLLKPFDFLLDNNFNKYQLQLSYYQIPLEDIDLKVIDREIIWLKEDSSFERLPTLDFSQHIRYYQSLST